VLSHYDLNSFPALRQAQGATALKEVGCLCCKAGTINGFLATPKSSQSNKLNMNFVII
jgi:hypothetical protein